MYIYPDNLRAKATFWLWQLKDIGIILALTQTDFWPPVVLTGVYAVLTIRIEDTSIMDFIRYACRYFLTRQYFEWRI